MAQIAGVAAGIAASQAEGEQGGDAIDRWPSGLVDKKEEEQPKAWVHTTKGELFFGGWIVLNAMVLAIECDHVTKKNEEDKDGVWVLMILLESMFNIVFAVECVLRLMAEKGAWVFSFWNWMDAFLVLIGVIDAWILKFVDSGANVGMFTLLRVFRLLRLLRLVRVLKVLKSNKELLLLLQGLGAAMRAMVWGMILLFIVNFICSLLVCRVVGKQMFDGAFTFEDEDGNVIDEWATVDNPYYFSYGTLSRTMFTLFMFTMEFQADTCRESFHNGPWLTYFLLFYTVLSCFALLGAIGSVIVEAILAISASNHEEEEAEEKEAERKETKDLMGMLYDALDQDGTKQLEVHDVDLSKEKPRALIKKCGIAPQEANEVFDAVADDKGVVPRDAFVQGMMRLKSDIQGKDMLKIECEIGACERKLASTIQKEGELLALLKGIAG